MENNMLKPVLIGFWKAWGNDKSNLVDKAIAIWTKGPYSHTEIFIPTDDKPITDTDKKWLAYTSSGTAGGVRVMERQLDHDRWDYYLLYLDDEQIERVKNFYSSIMGDKYDWAGIFGFILPVQDRTNRWFCSESVANAIKINGVEFMYKLDPAKLSPNSLARLLEKEGYERIKK